MTFKPGWYFVGPYSQAHYFKSEAKSLCDIDGTQPKERINTKMFFYQMCSVCQSRTGEKV